MTFVYKLTSDKMQLTILVLSSLSTAYCQLTILGN